MVTRKPLPQNTMVNSEAQAEPTMHGARQPSDVENVWAGDSSQQSTEQIPPSLRPASAASYGSLGDDHVWDDAGPAGNVQEQQSSEVARVPTVLRPGTGGVKVTDGAATAAGEDAKDILRVPTVLRPGSGKVETNPFKRKISANSQDELQLGGTSPMPTVPTRSFSQLSVSDSTKNPWQPAAEEKRGTPTVDLLTEPTYAEGGSAAVWDSAKPSRQATPGASNSPALVSLPSDEGSAGWEDEVPKKGPSPALPPPNEVMEDAHAWDDLGTVDKGKAPARPPQIPNASSAGVMDDWNLIDVEAPPGPPPKRSEWDRLIDGDDGHEEGTMSADTQPQDQPPELPPRRSAERAPALPARPVDKSETYQIKNINWYDVSAAKNPRTSPILVQNANGPCPLVALVNALTLTTPADKTTSLVNALRSREQVSLEFLLNAVFDELMSERRMAPDSELPDVTELYEFLKGLHTGMNVNPRFVPTPEVLTAFKRTSLTHLHPTERGDTIPGTFEDTKEMALYATFSIPLIHGWLPARDDPVYDSFIRQAVSYEDTQNLLFREEELEDKLSNTHGAGLTEEEQQIYQDILTIKSFLSISATQLTKWGLEVIRKSMRPGSVAILFRNDHFSTLYKHPQTQELLTLVTDAGYAGHAEVVWESLVDVNGERAEFFSGDFRLVGGASHTDQHRSSYQEPAPQGNNEGWTTVQRRGRNQASEQGQGEGDATEQADRDLALALQLQEEENEHHRAEQERRRRESLLSEQFIEQQARPNQRGGRGGANSRGGGHASGRGGSQTSLALSGQSAPARRSSNGVNIPVTTTSSQTGLRARPQTQTVRSLIPPSRAPAVNRAADEGVDDAPPSYEQAAKQTPYVPPSGHPAHPASTLGNGESSSTGAQAPTQPGPGTSPMNVRRNTGPGGGVPMRLRPGVPPAQVAGGGASRDRDCVVM
ncbi:protein FAM63A [Echria macrotheca]|uniref:Protein FAM63A n=1 Tax=Echria macrotheca TaxID=438768 RepID=A0AAJ0FHN7_9PEZI|nr:protein FAM63A [Echria macrotheca]